MAPPYLRVFSIIHLWRKGAHPEEPLVRNARGETGEEGVSGLQKHPRFCIPS